MIVHAIEFLQTRLKLLIISCYVGIAAIFVWSLTVDTHHAHTWAEKFIPGFWSLFGIGSCVLIVFIARLIAKAGVMTREDYYDN